MHAAARVDDAIVWSGLGRSPCCDWRDIREVFRLGTGTPGLPRDENPEGTTLVRILAERGYALGKNLILDARGAGEGLRTSHMLEEMKSANIDVIVTVGYKAALLRRPLAFRRHRLRQRKSGRDRSGG